MKNFRRAVKQSLRYWRALVLAWVCSLCVAALWGGNIGAIYPIIKVTLEGKSLQQWNAEREANSRRELAQIGAQLDELDKQLNSAPQHERNTLQRNIDKLTENKRLESAKQQAAQKLQPLLERYLPRKPFHTVVLIVVVLLCSTLLKNLFLVGNSLLVGHVTHNVCRNLRNQIFDQALALDRTEFAVHGSSGFVARITHSTEMLALGMTNFLGGAVREPLKIISCLIGACMISWRLVLVSLIVAPVVVFLIAWLGRRIKDVCERIMQKSVGFHHVMLESFNSIHTVQAFTMEDHERKRFAGVSGDMLRFTMRIIFYNSLTRPITELLGLGMVGTTMIVGSYLVLQNETHILGIRITDQPISISALLVFFGLLVGASDPIRKLSAVFSGINSGIVAADILYPLFETVPRIRDPENPIQVSHPHKTLLFQNVHFSYLPDEPVLKGVSLEIARGERVVIVGPNGCGKSSLTHLISRFYDPLQGAILLDDVDLRQMKVKDLRSRVGLVMQQSELFNEDIMYNIRYGSLEASDEDVIEAARKAHAHEFITCLTEGYRTRIGQNGQRLSGGQRQRIALARALLRSPEILILDEATSQIDVQSENLIYETVDKYCRDSTVILITHRAPALAIADRVIEIRDGIAEECSHPQQRVA